MANRRRQEFRRSVDTEIRVRAGMRCEECGVAIKLGGGEVHHIRPDGLTIDKSRPLTAKDGLLLCCGPGSCHARHTASDIPAIAKAKRRQAYHLGSKRAPRAKIANRGFPKTDPRPSIGAARIDKSTLPVLPRKHFGDKEPFA